MLKQAARSADVLARRLPDTDPDKEGTRGRIARLGNECGCSMSGLFLIAAIALVVAYAVGFGEMGVRLVVLGVGFVFTAAMLGKLTGISLALARLALIRRRLGGRVASVAESAHQSAARRA